MVENVRAMGPIELKHMAKRSFGARCSICLKNGVLKTVGACVKCTSVNCKRHLHVTCAKFAGTLRWQESKFVLFCDSHKVKKNISFSFDSIEKALNDRRKQYLIDVARFQNGNWLASKNKKVS